MNDSSCINCIPVNKYAARQLLLNLLNPEYIPVSRPCGRVSEQLYAN
jgi:hypothetical protein